MTKDIVEQIYREVEQRFTGIDDLAHGWEHVERVYRLALMLAQQERADRTIVGLAALMHDLGRSAPKDENTQQMHHADLSVIMAKELLANYLLPYKKQQEVLHAIVAHSFSRGVEPRSLEAKIVRDADRLDGLGAIGILRWAITGALKRTPDTRSYHPEDPFGWKHSLDDSQYMLDHFYCKLLKLGDTMLTETGQILAKQRTQFMLSYIEQLKQELVSLNSIPV